MRYDYGVHMEDEKEESQGSFETIKEKYLDWKSGHLWSARIREYFFLFVLWCGLFYCIFDCFDLFQTEVNSGRYLLSALVQSQAAIVAIVITLSLVAVQLTASAYSPRVIDIFKKNPDMWILLGFYGFSIFYGLFLLKLVKGVEYVFVNQSAEYVFVNQSAIWPNFHPLISLEHGVSMAYWLGAFTFVILIPYMWNIINLLNPSTILDRLTVKITKENLFESNDDPIQPIIDIVHGSIMRYDLATTRFGLKSLTDKIVELIATELAADGDHGAEVEALNNRFCIPVAFAGKLAVSREDEKSTLEVIENLQRFGVSIVKKANKEFVELEGAARQAAMSLGEVGRTAAEKDLEDATRQAAASLGVVGRTAAEKELESAAWQAARSLGILGKAAAVNELNGATWQAARSLESVGKTSAEKELKNVARQAALCLGSVGKTAAEKELKDAAKQAARSLGIVGKTSAKNEAKYATWQAARSLGIIGKAAVVNGLMAVAKRAVRSLEAIGKTAAEKGPKGALRQAALSLIDLGVANLRNGYQESATQAAKSLAELALLNNKIVDKALHEFDSIVKEENEEELTAFQKFEGLYGQEQEKLRAEQQK